MNISQAILLLLKGEGKPLQGKTMLQKRLYFLARLRKLEFGYRAHYYGPYSEKISSELESLVASGLVRHKATPLGAHDVYGEMTRHDFQLDDGVSEDPWLSEPDAQIALETLKKIGDHDVARDQRLLSAAAKVDLILSSQGSATVGQIQSRAKDLGWNLEPDQIAMVGNYLLFLGLVRSRRKPS